MPLAVYLLGLGIFAQGTSEFMLSGLLPSLATDLGVSIPDAGLLISAFAVGMIVGAPLLAVLTLRWPRRTALVAFQAVFIAAHIVAALAPGYGTLFATRVVSALAYAGFWAVAAIAALSMTGPGSRAKAMAVVAGGLSVAMIVGVPAGTLLGQYAGWRAAFWAVAVLTAASLVSLLVALPGGSPRTAEPVTLHRELRTMRTPRLWLAYANTALSVGAVVVTFSYLASLLTEVSGVPESWVPGVLALYGLGALAGLTVGGRTSDARPFGTLLLGIGGLVVVSVALALTAESAAAAVTLSFLLGFTGFVTNPAVNQRVATIARKAPTLAMASNTSAFNVGITLAPLLGGLAIGAGYGFASVAWTGAGIGVVGVLAVLLARALEARHTGRTGPADEQPEGVPEVSRETMSRELQGS